MSMTRVKASNVAINGLVFPADSSVLVLVLVVSLAIGRAEKKQTQWSEGVKRQQRQGSYGPTLLIDYVRL